jgi:hypothetical protein
MHKIVHHELFGQGRPALGARNWPSLGVCVYSQFNEETGTPAFNGNMALPAA